MRKLALLGAGAGIMLACALPCAAQDKGPWLAASTEAKAITGDIAIANTKVEIDYITFPLAFIRRLKPEEVSAVFDADVNAGISGDLYRLKISPFQRFQHKNTLCGTDETQWMATYVTGKTMQVAFFSGDDEPVFTFGAMTNATDRCGVFTYAR